MRLSDVAVHGDGAAGAGTVVEASTVVSSATVVGGASVVGATGVVGGATVVGAGGVVGGPVVAALEPESLPHAATERNNRATIANEVRCITSFYRGWVSGSRMLTNAERRPACHR